MKLALRAALLALAMLAALPTVAPARVLQSFTPVNKLADPHHLADSDPVWAGGDVLALQRLARAVTPSAAHPALALVGLVPGPVAGVLRTGLDILADLAPNGKPA